MELDNFDNELQELNKVCKKLQLFNKIKYFGIFVLGILIGMVLVILI